MKRHRIIPKTCYLTLHLWLRKQCNRMTQRQRRRFIYGLSLAYVCSGIAVLTNGCRSCCTPQEEQRKKTQREERRDKILCRFEESILKLKITYGKEISRPH